MLPSPIAPLVSLWTNRTLVGRLVRREVDAKFRGSQLGLTWYLLLPFLMMLVYTLVFGVIFQTRWPRQMQGGTEIVALYLFSGLLIFTILAEVVSRAPGLVLENVAYVKKVVFPLEVLPWVSLFSSLVTFAASMIVFFVLYLSMVGLPPPTILLLPALLAPFLLFILGLAWFLSSLGVFVRDIRHFISALITILMFMGPIFFPSTAVPERFRWLLAVNPATIPVEMSKALIFDGVVPPLGPWLVYTAFGAIVAWLGFAWFMRTKKAFADVI
jgi:lipopolysaccharide transport system permease protein